MTQFLCHIEIQIHFFRVIYDNIDMQLKALIPIHILHTTKERRFQFLYKLIGEKTYDEFKNEIILRIKQKRGREKETTHNKNQFISFRTL